LADLPEEWLRDAEEASGPGNEQDELKRPGLSEANMIQFNNHFLNCYRAQVQYLPIKLLNESCGVYQTVCNDCQEAIWRKADLKPGIAWGEHHANHHIHRLKFKNMSKQVRSTTHFYALN
jgi:hypothetical protein